MPVSVTNTDTSPKSTESQVVVSGLREWVKRTSIKVVAKRLIYSLSYIHQIIREKNPMKPGKPFIKRYRRVTRPRKPPKPRIVITFDDPGLAEFAKGLSMEERRKIMEAHNETKTR